MKTLASLALFGLVATFDENELFAASIPKPSQSRFPNNPHSHLSPDMLNERQRPIRAETHHSSGTESRIPSGKTRIDYSYSHGPKVDKPVHKSLETDDDEYFNIGENQTEKKQEKGFFEKFESLLKGKFPKKQTSNDLGDEADDHELIHFKGIAPKAPIHKPQPTLSFEKMKEAAKHRNHHSLIKGLDDKADDHELVHFIGPKAPIQTPQPTLSFEQMKEAAKHRNHHSLIKGLDDEANDLELIRFKDIGPKAPIHKPQPTLSFEKMKEAAKHRKHHTLIKGLDDIEDNSLFDLQKVLKELQHTQGANANLPRGSSMKKVKLVSSMK